MIEIVVNSGCKFIFEVLKAFQIFFSNACAAKKHPIFTSQFQPDCCFLLNRSEQLVAYRPVIFVLVPLSRQDREKTMSFQFTSIKKPSAHYLQRFNLAGFVFFFVNSLISKLTVQAKYYGFGPIRIPQRIRARAGGDTPLADGGLPRAQDLLVIHVLEPDVHGRLILPAPTER